MIVKLNDSVHQVLTGVNLVAATLLHILSPLSYLQLLLALEISFVSSSARWKLDPKIKSMKKRIQSKSILWMSHGQKLACLGKKISVTS